MSRATRLTQLLAATSLALLVGLAAEAQADVGPRRKSQASVPLPNFDNSRNRSFDPATGRFLQRDPVLGGDPLYNPYCFPGNNPVTGSDPMGTDGIHVGFDGTVYWTIDMTKATDLSFGGFNQFLSSTCGLQRLALAQNNPMIAIGTLNARGDVVLGEPFNQTRPAARLADLKAVAKGAKYIKFDRDNEDARRQYVAGQINILNGSPSPTLDFIWGGLGGGVQGVLDTAEGAENTLIKLARIPAWPVRKFGGAVICFSGHFFFRSPKMESFGMTLVEKTIPEHKWSPDLVQNPEWSRSFSKIAGGEGVFTLGTWGIGAVAEARHLAKLGEARQLWSYVDAAEDGLRAGNFISSSGRGYMTARAPGPWLTEQGFGAGFSRWCSTGRWSAYQSPYAFTTGESSVVLQDFSPIRTGAVNFWKMFGRQYRTRIGVGGYERAGDTLVGRALSAGGYRTAKAIGAEFTEQGANAMATGAWFYYLPHESTGGQ